MPKQKPKTLQQLKTIWYDKLAKSGFEDIEERNSPRQMLKRWHAADFRKRSTPETYIAKRDYFQQATEFLNWYEFSGPRERKIWELHSEGATIREIAKKVRLKKDKVHRIIKKLRKESLCPN